MNPPASNILHSQPSLITNDKLVTKVHFFFFNIQVNFEGFVLKSIEKNSNQVVS